MCVDVAQSIVNEALQTAFSSVPASEAEFFHTLEKDGRLGKAFHVTLMHRASSKQHPELWHRYCDMRAKAESQDEQLGTCRIMLERVCYTQIYPVVED